MKKSLLIAASVFILLFFPTASALAASVLLGEFSESQLFSGSESRIDFQGSYHLYSDIGWGPGDGLLRPTDWHGWKSMIDLPLDSDHQGAQRIYQAGDPGFDQNVKVLTNGLNDAFGFMGFNFYGFMRESSLYSNGHGVHYYGLNIFDFAGCTIDSIAFTLNDFTAATSSSDGNFNYTVSIYGSPAPIPGAFWLLGSGLLAIVGFRRRFKKNS